MTLAPATGAKNLKIEIKKRLIINFKKYKPKLLMKRLNKINKIRNLTQSLKLDRLSEFVRYAFTTLNSKINLNDP
jgi:hypothetical protein